MLTAICNIFRKPAGLVETKNGALFTRLPSQWRAAFADLERLGLIEVADTAHGVVVMKPDACEAAITADAIEVAMELRTWAEMVARGDDTRMEPGETIADVMADWRVARLVHGGFLTVDPISGVIEPTEAGWKAAGYSEERQKPELTVVASSPSQVRPERTKKEIAREQVERLSAPVQQAELVRRWGVAKSTASEWLSEWQQQGVVRRSADRSGALLVQTARIGRLRVVGEQPNGAEQFGER